MGNKVSEKKYNTRSQKRKKKVDSSDDEEEESIWLEYSDEEDSDEYSEDGI